MTQREAFERWVRAGGGVVAIHAAANADRDWAFYGELLGGARFLDHRQGPLQRETVLVERHPATEGLPRRWVRSDEWYRFAPEPGPAADVLATVDGDPMIWTSEVDSGRALYTALGHAGEAWSEPRYREHVFAAVEWAHSDERRDRQQLHHHRRHEVPRVVRPDVGGDREQEVDDEPDAGGDADRRPEQPGDQARCSREEDPGEPVEPVLGHADPRVGLDDLRAV